MLKSEVKVMLHNILNGIPVILASASPRRKEILSLLGLSYDVVISSIAEPITDEEPYIQAMRHAVGKTAAVNRPNALIIGADTIVVLQDQILGKPSNEAQAREYLKMLSGCEHEVITGICVRYREGYYSAHARSKVRFSELTDEEIKAYISTGEPMDKAGAYGIQGYGSQFIYHIQGCYFNVMGFPVQTFYALIQQMQEHGEL